MKNGLKKSMVAGLAAVAVVGSLAFVVVASAKTNHKGKPAVEKVAAVDTDNIQSGDQTSPDNAATSVKATAEGAKATAKGATATAKAAPVKAASAPADEGSPSENDGENSASNDGPGGHQDTPGVDVNHEFNGQE
jgi:hypothetical protein